MTKTNEITEEDKLFAEFMDVKEVTTYYDSYGQQTPCYYTDNDLYRTPTFGHPGNSFNNFIDAAKYHESWDWLMPVVEKIESLGFVIEIALSQACLYKKPSKYNFSCNLLTNSKIEAVIYVMVEFIKWHNTQKL